jgi:hypothetical protein
MSRLTVVGVELVDDFETVGVVEIFGGKDAVFAVDLEQDDRDHQGAGQLKSMVLSEREIV